MHIMEGFLPAEHCVAWTAVSAPFVVEWWRALGDRDFPGTDPLPFAPAD